VSCQKEETLRKTVKQNGLSVKTYAGTTGVLLAMNVTPAKRAGLLGFALERRAGSYPKERLTGMLNYPGVPHQPGDLVPTNVRFTRLARSSACNQR